MKKIIDIFTAAAGAVTGMICMISGNSLDMALFAVPFVLAAVLSGKDGRMRTLCLLFYGGALLTVAPLRLMNVYTSSLRPAIACLCPLFAYAAVNIRRTGIFRLFAYMALAFGGLVFTYGRAGAIGCGLFLALAAEMLRTAYDQSMIPDTAFLKK